jgi:hypothetical protein
MDNLTIKYWSPHGRQEESKFKTSDHKIDLIMRAAKRIDLEGLHECTNLETLDFSHNSLEDIDLQPLSRCNSLRSLVLHDNHLQSINLWPLSGVQSLEEIDLAANRLAKIDITPIFLKCSMHLDASVVVTADSVLRYLLTTDEISRRFRLLRADRAPWAAAPVIIWNAYKQLAKMGWASIRERIITLLDQIDERSWFATQRGLFEGLGLSELAGLDSNPAAALENARSTMTYEEAVDAIEESMVALLEEQIENGGPTLFLDADVIRKTRASKLIPKILESRKREIDETRVPIRGSRVFLRSLWLTHYGYQILSALGMGLRTDLAGLSRIKTCFDEIGFDLRTKKMSRIRHRYSSNYSAGMKRHVYDVILGKLS